ncbi:MAG: imidazolonepropionase [Candidatus Izemoplasmataceae bacterium]
MTADCVIYNIHTLLSPQAQTDPIKGKAMSMIERYHSAFVAIKDGKILDFGEGEYEPLLGEDTRLVDAKGRLVTPGLIDGHTHLVHAGSRELEAEKTMMGVPYLKILEEGGGILSTVEATRNASFESLYDQSHKSLDRMLSYGVTQVEGKSGYGLEVETELKQLRVQKKLDQDHPVDIHGTYLKAHALPEAYKDKRAQFIDNVIEGMDRVKEENLARFVDVFCEKGAFTLEESEKVLRAARDKGFGLKIHADEMHSLGGVAMAADLGAHSADHLMVIDETGIEALKNARTVANLLPATSFYLGKDYAPARRLIDEGLALSLSSDYNPGSSPSENFLFTLNLAALKLKMRPDEILTAATANGAHALGIGKTHGAIAKGYQADLVLWDAPNWPYVLYHYAVNHVHSVYKNGVKVFENECIERRMYNEAD